MECVTGPTESLQVCPCEYGLPPHPSLLQCPEPLFLFSSPLMDGRTKGGSQWKGKRVVELGSGLGHLAWGLYKLGAHVTCTDTPLGDLESLRKRIAGWLADEVIHPSSPMKGILLRSPRSSPSVATFPPLPRRCTDLVVRRNREKRASMDPYAWWSSHGGRRWAPPRPLL